MLVRGRKPDTITYNTIIYANCKQGSISTARVSTLLVQKMSGNQMYRLGQLGPICILDDIVRKAYEM
ncbi:hypothetical protein COP2_022258 [Malus domestica]